MLLLMLGRSGLAGVVGSLTAKTNWRCNGNEGDGREADEHSINQIENKGTRGH